jgi:hypothetical protein
VNRKRPMHLSGASFRLDQRQTIDGITPMYTGWQWMSVGLHASLPSDFPHPIMKYAEIKKLLGPHKDLLDHACKTISKDRLHLPSMKNVESVFEISDRPSKVIKHLKDLYGHGRLGGTGYLSILPVDQGIEHSAGASFAKNPDYFDPENIVKLALDGGCNAVASTVGVLGMVSKKYATKIPFIVKLNHNELLTYPNKFDQIMFGLCLGRCSRRKTWAQSA